MDRAWSDRYGRVHLLALDWRKAFDSVNIDALLNALRRFGLPGHLLNVLRSIYSDRVFVVAECRQTSVEHSQRSGICQGCPLSPFLFIMVMSIMMRDARDMLSEACLRDVLQDRLYDILYADDTLAVTKNGRFINRAKLPAPWRNDSYFYAAAVVDTPACSLAPCWTITG